VVILGGRFSMKQAALFDGFAFNQKSSALSKPLWSGLAVAGFFVAC
jgi:hypothetical protein